MTITFGGTSAPAFGATAEVELADPPPVQLARTPIEKVRAKSQRPTQVLTADPPPRFPGRHEVSGCVSLAGRTLVAPH
jgi:hypothetical protein